MDNLTEKIHVTKNIIMKKIYLILIFTLSLSCKAQQAQEKPGTDLLVNLQPFVGVWEYREGNDIFRVNIWENNRYLKGHVEFIEVDLINGLEVETVVKTSDRCEANGFCHFPVIFGGSGDGQLMSGLFSDNTIIIDNVYKGKFGYMSLTIIQNNCTTCPTTAQWIVKEHRGFKLDTEPENFSVPIDVILTKVN